MRIPSLLHARKPGLASLIALAALSTIHSQALELQRATAVSAVLGGVSSKKPSIYKEGWIDLNKDGVKSVYEDPTQPVDKRVEDLLGRMNHQEKIGQLWQGPDSPSDGQLDLIAQGGLGSYPGLPEPELRNSLQRAAVEDSRLGIPLQFGMECAPAAAPGYIQQAGFRNGGKLTDGQLDDKVRVILKRKFTSGLFEQPYTKAKPAGFINAKSV